MSTQQNNFPRRERVGMIRSFMLRRKLLAGVAAILMGASLVFSGSASAHDVDLKKAREVTREYARSVRAASNGRYLHYSTRCRKLFPHIVQCEIEYQNAQDTAKGVYTCKEGITVYFRPHSSAGEDYTLYGKHHSANACGGTFLNNRLG